MTRKASAIESRFFLYSKNHNREILLKSVFRKCWLCIFAFSGICSILSVAAQEPIIVCKTSSPSNNLRERRLIGLINHLKTDTSNALAEVDSVAGEMHRFSTRIDKYNSAMQTGAEVVSSGLAIINKSKTLLSAAIRARDKIITSLAPAPGLPGVELDTREKTLFGIDWLIKSKGSKSKGIIQLSPAKAAIDIFNETSGSELSNPSAIADWITGATKAVADTRLTITTESASRMKQLTDDLQNLRNYCKEESDKFAKSSTNISRPTRVGFLGIKDSDGTPNLETSAPPAQPLQQGAEWRGFLEEVKADLSFLLQICPSVYRIGPISNVALSYIQVCKTSIPSYQRMLDEWGHFR